MLKLVLPDPAASTGCADIPPAAGVQGSFTCTQQKAFGQCGAAFMRGFCNNSCGRCPAASVIDRNARVGKLPLPCYTHSPHTDKLQHSSGKPWVL